MNVQERTLGALAGDHQAISIDPNDIFNKLMALGPPDSISVPQALQRIGSLIDLAGDLNKEEAKDRK